MMRVYGKGAAMDKSARRIKGLCEVSILVKNLIVLPLSAAPALPAPPLWLRIELVLQHILLIGLPLGILVRWNAKTN